MPPVASRAIGLVFSLSLKRENQVLAAQQLHKGTLQPEWVVT